VNADEITQIRFNLSWEQRSAVQETARKLGVSQGTILRDAVAIVTQTPNRFKRAPFMEKQQGRHRGIAAPDREKAGAQ
jgi:hypothetical protein